jgi:hypothetical protein
MRQQPSKFAVTLAGLALLLSAALTAANQVIISTAAVVDYSANPYVLQAKGQNFGQYVPIVLWDQQPLVVVVGSFTPVPDANGFQTFSVELPDPTPPGSYQLTVTPTNKAGKPLGYGLSAAFEVTIGTVGPQGPKGDKGDKGDQGPIGSIGPTGATGATGATGPEGPQGLQGPKGDQGIQGIQGIQGEKGDQGLKGDKGDQGLKGDKGDQGIPGVKGDKGDQGIPGVKGDKGDTGAQGPEGAQGPAGPVGPTLPYSGTMSSSGAALEVTNNGGGPAVSGFSSNEGVYGWGGYYGVYGWGGYAGVTGGGNAYGVYGTCANGAGVYGSGQNPGSSGVHGYGDFGVYGEGTTYGVYSAGNFAATGTKSFVEPHPTDPTKTIRYVALEGPEAGTYFRGTARTVGREAVIEVPETFRIVTAEEGLTVQLTPVGEFAQMAVFSQDLSQIVVRSTREVTFHYLVQGVRRAFKDWQVLAEGQEFRPASPDQKMPSWLTEEAKSRLISNGTYDSDGTVNMNTAERLGWAQKWRDEASAKAAQEAAAAKSK